MKEKIPLTRTFCAFITLSSFSFASRFYSRETSPQLDAPAIMPHDGESGYCPNITVLILCSHHIIEALWRTAALMSCDDGHTLR